MAQDVEQISKLSTKSFKQLFQELKENHAENLIKIKEQKAKNLEKAKTKQQKQAVMKKYILDKKMEDNKYALSYNAINNQKLYRKGAFEFKVSKLKEKYNQRRAHAPDFNKEVEKDKLNAKIKDLRAKYSRPISARYRKSRTSKPTETSFVKIPLNSPLRKNLRTIFFIFCAALISTLVLDIFLKPFGLYSAGLRGVTQTIYYAILHYYKDFPVWSSYLIFIAVNIPLAIFGYQVVGKKFTMYTLLFLLLQYLMSTLFTVWKVEDLMTPFGKTQEELKEIIATHQKGQEFYYYGLPIISSIIGGSIYGISVGMVYKAGASTGGSKFVITWVSAKKDISIGRMAILVSIFVVFLGVLVNHVIIGGENFISAFTSITLFATVISIIISNFALDRTYTYSKKVIVSVITTKKDQILHFMDVKFMYNRKFNVSKVKSNFYKTPNHKIEFLVSYSESKTLANIFKQIDSNALITSTRVQKAYGKIYTYWYE